MQIIIIYNHYMVLYLLKCKLNVRWITAWIVFMIKMQIVMDRGKPFIMILNRIDYYSCILPDIKYAIVH